MFERELICEVPEGQKGDWKVIRFEVTQKESDFGALRAAIQPRLKGRGTCPTGTFTKLERVSGGFDKVMMSDTPDEMEDFMPFTRCATDIVLISGLGLGMTVEAVLMNRMVRQVVVLEIDQDIIDLVAPYYRNRWRDGQLEIIHADAFTWKNPNKYVFSSVWHDIWPTICSDNLPGMRKLHAKYRRWMIKGGIQESWQRERCLAAKRRGC